MRLVNSSLAKIKLNIRLAYFIWCTWFLIKLTNTAISTCFIYTPTTRATSAGTTNLCRVIHSERSSQLVWEVGTTKKLNLLTINITICAHYKTESILLIQSAGCTVNCFRHFKWNSIFYSKIFYTKYLIGSRQKLELLSTSYSIFRDN